jgi:hypothetical protein
VLLTDVAGPGVLLTDVAGPGVLLTDVAGPGVHEWRCAYRSLPLVLFPSLTASSSAEMHPESMNLCCVAWAALSSDMEMGKSRAFRACIPRHHLYPHKRRHVNAYHGLSSGLAASHAQNQEQTSHRRSLGSRFPYVWGFTL